VYARRWRTLGVLCLSLMIVMVGNVSVNVALPAMARDLDASAGALQWVVDAYALVFAGLLFTAGTLGDRFGRKGALQGGLVLFLVGAALATVADGVEVVIAARGVMGVAAAFVMPSTLSILANVFPERERGRAISIWAGIAAGGAAIGPVASGLLVERFWWGSVFLVNVPLILLALIGGLRLVPTSRDPEHQPLDWHGALLSVAGVGTLVYAIIEGPAHGWTSPRTLATFAVAAAALGLFGVRERTARHPMLDLRLFRDRRFGVASGGMALTYFAMFGAFFLVSQYLQLVRGHSPLEAGAILLPIPVVMLTLAPQAPRLVERFGVARVAPFGLGLIALGLAVLGQAGPDSPLGLVFAALVPMAAGVSLTGTPLTTLMMSAVPLGRAGVGSAMNDTSRELGGALGVAVLGSLAATRYASAVAPALDGAALPADRYDAAAAGLPGALDVAGRLGGAPGQALADAARSAFADGFGLAALVGAALVLATAAATALLLPRPAVRPAVAGSHPSPGAAPAGLGGVAGAGPGAPGPAPAAAPAPVDLVPARAGYQDSRSGSVVRSSGRRREVSHATSAATSGTTTATPASSPGTTTGTGGRDSPTSTSRDIEVP
jgi:EmrB/QacA subfamily drug resistance transporter